MTEVKPGDAPQASGNAADHNSTMLGSGRDPALSGELLSIAEACAHIQRLTGQRKRPSTNSIWRWMRRGVRARNGQRVRLDHVRVGARLHTTTAAIEQFFAELAAADAQHFEVEPEREQVRRSATETTSMDEHKRAMARLKQRGLS